MKPKHIIAAVLLLGAAGCMWQPYPPPEQMGQPAYVAVKMSKDELRSSVHIQAATDLQKPGKIYIKDNLLFINEKNKGVHIFDNSDPKNPKNLSYIEAAGTTDIASKDNALYLDNVIDMVTIDIGDPVHPRFANRLENVLPALAPTDRQLVYGNFDPNTQVVVEWKDTTISY